MKHCPSCHKQYPDSTLFCRDDGSPLEGFESAPTQGLDAHCKACGESVDPDALFCPRCGAKVYTQKGLNALHRSDRGEGERRFTLGADESLNRTAELERPQQTSERTEADRAEEWRPRKKARRGLYAAGGAIVALAVFAIFAVPRIVDYWHSNETAVANLPSPPQSPAPTPSPPLAEPAPAPNPQEGTAAVPGFTEQTQRTPALPPPENPAAVASKEATPPSKPAKHPSKRSVRRESELAAKKEATFPPVPESAKTGESTSLKETPVPRRPAEPGTYETVRMAMARRDPSDSAEIVDQIKPRTRLTVTGSEGNWLVVHSITKNRTVYVRRDDAMFISEKVSTAPSPRELELKWKELERQIQQALSNQGITGVSVSFIRDTAYLKGTVQTEQQRFSAEQAAWSFPEVRYIFNGIWVKR